MGIYKKQEEELLTLINKGMLLLAKMACEQTSLSKEQAEQFKMRLE